MGRYIWESERNLQDVLNNITVLTDKPNVIDRNLYDYKSFDYKCVGAEEYSFTLWFYFASSRASYQPAPVKGIITATTGGCKIEAHLQRWITMLDSAVRILLLVTLYISAIAAPIAGFKGWIAVSIISGLVATGILMRFLYTLKKWGSKNVLLEIIDNAANTERQHLC